MDFEKEIKSEFVDPPEYTKVDVENFEIKLRSFGMGDLVHKDIEKCAGMRWIIRSSETRGGWTQKTKDDFLERVKIIKNRILELETQKAKSLGL